MDNGSPDTCALLGVVIIHCGNAHNTLVCSGPGGGAKRLDSDNLCINAGLAIKSKSDAKHIT